jgi:hypothetical protein
MEPVTTIGCTLVDSLRREEVFVTSLEVLAIPSTSLLIDGTKACCQNTEFWHVEKLYDAPRHQNSEFLQQPQRWNLTGITTEVEFS